MLSTDVEPLSLCLLRRAAAEQGLRIDTALYDARAPASPLPLIGGRAADLLLVSDCFVTPGLAAALGARVAEALEQRTTVLVVDPHRPTRADFVGALLRHGVEPWRAQFGEIQTGGTSTSAARREIVPGAGELHLFETSVGVPVFYEI